MTEGGDITSRIIIWARIEVASSLLPSTLKKIPPGLDCEIPVIVKQPVWMCDARATEFEVVMRESVRDHVGFSLII